jgi:hypothetical protein
MPGSNHKTYKTVSAQYMAMPFSLGYPDKPDLPVESK